MPMRAKPKRAFLKNKKRDTGLPIRKKVCRFCLDKNRVINYKEVKSLEYFIKERGKIYPRRASGNCSKHQRSLREAIKQARFLSLLPYVRM